MQNNHPAPGALYRTYLVVLTATALLAMVAACGSSYGGDSGSSTSPTSTESAGNTGDMGGTTTMGTSTGGSMSGTTAGETTTTTGASMTTGGTSSTTTGGTSSMTTGGMSGTTTGSTCATTDTWTNYAQQFFAMNCASCHSPTGSEGTAFFDGTSYSSVNTHRSQISSAISSGFMPQGKTLSSADKTRIETWLACNPPPQ